jgi:SAM-dependent methyltransferase
MTQASRRQQIVGAYFDRAASFWDAIYRHADVYSLVYQERQAAILSLVAELGLPESARVLDVGCGAGYVAVELARRGFSVEAVDRSYAMVQTTLANLNHAGLIDRVKVRQLDIHTLDQPAASFDLVLSIGVLPWLDSIDEPLRSLARVLAPGGHLITTIDNRWAWHRVLDIRTNPVVQSGKDLARRALEMTGLRRPLARARTTSIRELDNALRKAGFAMRTGLTLGFGPFTFWNRNLLSQTTGVRLHRRLRALADGGNPLLRAGGAQYVVSAAKKQQIL